MGTGTAVAKIFTYRLCRKLCLSLGFTFGHRPLCPLLPLPEYMAARDFHIAKYGYHKKVISSFDGCKAPEIAYVFAKTNIFIFILQGIRVERTESRDKRRDLENTKEPSSIRGHG